MTKLVLIRHGYSQGNRLQLYTGQLDLPLEPLGEQQADCAAAYILQNYAIDAVYSSDLSRAVRTVQPVADALHLPIHLHEGLREIHDGDWHGRKFADLKVEEPELTEALRQSPGTFRFPNGESFASAQARVVKAVNEIIAENPNKTVLIGSHHGALRVLLAAWMNIPLTELYRVPRLNNCSVSVAEAEGAQIRLVEVNHDDHVAAMETQ